MPFIPNTQIRVGESFGPNGGIPIIVPVIAWAAGNSSLSANATDYNAFWVPSPGMTIYYGHTHYTGAGGNIQMGIYDSSGTNGAPGTRLATTGTVAHPGTSDQFTAIPSVDLDPGKYYIALARDSANNHQYHTTLIGTGGFYPTWYGETVYPLPATASASVVTHTVHFSFFALGSPYI